MAGTGRAVPLFMLYANINKHRNFWAALVWTGARRPEHEIETRAACC